MIYPNVNELFIYFRVTDDALKIVRSSRMNFSKATSFNDPFDCTVPLAIDYDPVVHAAGYIRLGINDGKSWDEIKTAIGKDVEIDASLNDEARKRIDDQANEFQKSNSELGIICFTENPISILMWSHYGGKHRGIVLGFAREDGTELGDEDACSPVVYSDEYPTPKFSDILHADGRLTEKLMLTKAREWAYEKEWRAFYEGPSTEIEIPGPINSIIVGCNAPDSLIEDCRIEAARLGIPLLRTKKVPGKFALNLESI